ncbi:ribosome recycling factor [Patescibacteria group bacterium]|nr:ribosome recycling factor [Patescibacteria group bacterium]
MYKEAISEAKEGFQSAVDFLAKELTSLRTGRAHTSLVENISVSSYGTVTPLMQLATISTPEAQLIVIDPFDKNILKEIEKAVSESDLGISPINDGKILRVQIPALTEERRKELVSVLNQKLEEARISIRNVREEAWKKIKAAEGNSEITEDEKYKAEEELNAVVSDYNDKIKEIGEKKEQEIMTV